MASNVVTSHQWGPPTVGTRDGNWVWDGSNWVCSPDCSPPVSCPPFGPPVFSGPVGQPPWYPGANGGVSFGATAPPNPVRGHMWWDGTTFWLFDGAAWVGIGPEQAPGAVPTTAKVFQVATNSSSTLGAAATWQIPAIDGTPTINTAGAWDAVNYKYTPNKPGIYNFEIQQYSGNAGTMAIMLAINDSGSPLNIPASQSICLAQTPAPSWMTASGMVVMNGTTDFVRLWAQPGAASDNWPVTGYPNIRAFLLP
jgi:hypothetical protein